jgi:hypothetical protein
MTGRISTTGRGYGPSTTRRSCRLAQTLLNGPCPRPAHQTRPIWPSIPLHDNDGSRLSCHHLVRYPASFLSPLMPRVRPSPMVGRGGDLLLRPRPKVGRGGASYCAWGWTWLLLASPWWVAQQSEQSGWCCFPARSVSGRAKWLRSLRPCRLRHVCQNKASDDPRIECACDTVGWWGDLAKVASQRSLPELDFGRVEGVPVAWGGPRARREFAWDYCSRPRLGSGEARSRPWKGIRLTPSP